MLTKQKIFDEVYLYETLKDEPIPHKNFTFLGQGSYEITVGFLPPGIRRVKLRDLAIQDPYFDHHNPKWCPGLAATALQTKLNRFLPNLIIKFDSYIDLLPYQC